MTLANTAGCLLDADRIDCAQFDDPLWEEQRPHAAPSLGSLVQRLEAHLENMPPTRSIDRLRSRVAEQCARRASDAPGLFTLTVPTGGRKTLASLRFALRHAQEHDLDGIIYIIPYTSIIYQKALVPVAPRTGAWIETSRPGMACAGEPPRDLLYPCRAYLKAVCTAKPLAFHAVDRTAVVFSPNQRISRVF